MNDEPQIRSIDELVMLSLLATARAEARNTRPAQELRMASKLLCFLFDPLKPPAYTQAMRDFREAFVGIEQDDQLQELFVASFTHLALTGDDPEALFTGGRTAIVGELELEE